MSQIIDTNSITSNTISA